MEAVGNKIYVFGGAPQKVFFLVILVTSPFDLHPASTHHVNAIVMPCEGLFNAVSTPFSRQLQGVRIRP